MQHILQVIGNLSLKSGVSSVIMNFYRHINRQKFQFDFLVCNEQCPQSYHDEILKLGGKIFYVGNPLSAAGLIPAIYHLQKFFKQYGGEYSILHLHSPTLSKFVLPYAKKQGIAHRIVHSHSSMTSPYFIKAHVNQFLTSNIANLANHYWACSTPAGKFLYGQKLPFTFIPNAIALEHFTFNSQIRRQFRAQLGLQPNHIAVMHVSNFSPIKNLSFLAPVIQQVIKQKPQMRFVFVGEGLTRVGLQQQLQQANVMPWCIFTGFTTQTSNFLQAADLFVLPSLKEGLPVSVVEAQAVGLPCAISDTITQEVQIGTTTFLPLQGGAWIDYLRNFMPYAEHQRILNSQAAFATPFNIQRQVPTLERLYGDMK